MMQHQPRREVPSRREIKEINLSPSQERNWVLGRREEGSECERSTGLQSSTLRLPTSQSRFPLPQQARTGHLEGILG